MSTEDTEAVSAASAKRARFTGQMRHVPGPVAIIAAQADGTRNGLAATAWTSLSADPPMLLVCVNRLASAHKVIQRAGAFSVNLLADDELETVDIFSAQRGLDGEARFLDGQWSAGPRGQPMFENALVTFECVVADSHDYGTHTIFIGEVDAMGGTGQSSPFIYFDATFAALMAAANNI
ncbi:MAG: flavin reductase family protein [Sphingobium sp.]